MPTKFFVNVRCYLEVEGAHGGTRWTLGCVKNPVAIRADLFPGDDSCHREGAVRPPSSASRENQMTASVWPAMMHDA